MKGIKKYLVAVCVLALSVVMLAGCSSQASSSAASASGSASGSASASSAASQASQEDLIKELEAIVGSKDAKSVTINIEGAISIDTDAMVAAATESSDSSASASASAASASAESASASSSNAVEIPIKMVIKADESQDPKKMYMSMDLMGMPFELYITGDNVVMVVSDQVYGGTLQDLEALGMSQYSSVESAMSSTGAASSFDQYKDAIQSVTKEEVNGKTVYTLVLDIAKIDNQQATSSLSQVGAAGDLTTMTLTYVVADGKLASSTMEMGATGFSMVTTATVTDVDKTVIPDAPEATQSFSDLSGLMGSASAAASSSAADAA